MNDSRVRRRFCTSKLLFIGVVMMGVVGCGPGVERKDLGEVVFKVPEIPGAEKPFPLPQLEAPSEVAADSAAQAVTPEPTEPADATVDPAEEEGNDATKDSADDEGGSISADSSPTESVPTEPTDANAEPATSGK